MARFARFDETVLQIRVEILMSTVDDINISTLTRRILNFTSLAALTWTQIIGMNAQSD